MFKISRKDSIDFKTNFCHILHLPNTFIVYGLENDDELWQVCKSLFQQPLPPPLRPRASLLTYCSSWHVDAGARTSPWVMTHTEQCVGCGSAPVCETWSFGVLTGRNDEGGDVGDIIKGDKSTARDDDSENNGTDYSSAMNISSGGGLLGPPSASRQSGGWGWVGAGP